MVAQYWALLDGRLGPTGPSLWEIPVRRGLNWVYAQAHDAITDPKERDEFIGQLEVSSEEWAEWLATREERQMELLRQWGEVG